MVVVIPLSVKSVVSASVTDSSAVMTMMPQSSFEMRHFTCKKPVTAPAARPAKKDRKTAGSGTPSRSIKMVQTTPPSGKVPSTDRSAKSRME